jgi:hypothetical protein
MGGNLINKVDPVTEFLTRVTNSIARKNDVPDFESMAQQMAKRGMQPKDIVRQIHKRAGLTDIDSRTFQEDLLVVEDIIDEMGEKAKNDDSSSDDSDKKNASDDELLEGIRDLIEEGVPKDKIVKDIVKESGADEARIRRLVREAYSF